MDFMQKINLKKTYPQFTDVQRSQNEARSLPKIGLCF